jgi:hypothetical protein
MELQTVSKPSSLKAAETVFKSLDRIYELRDTFKKKFEQSTSEVEINTLTIKRMIDSEYIRIGVALQNNGNKNNSGSIPCADQIQKCICTYERYFKFILERNRGTDKNTQREFTEIAESLMDGGTEDYLKKLMTINPLVATTSGHLLVESSEEQSRHVRKIERWFLETLEYAQAAHKHMSVALNYLDKRIGKNTINMSPEDMHTFLADFHGDISDFIAGCLHTACSLAAHAQEEDCAVYMPQTEYYIGRDPSVLGTWQQKMEQLLKHNIYTKFSKAIEGSGVQGTKVHIPTFISIIDVHEFLRFFSEFWEKLPNRLQKRFTRNPKRADIVCHPVATTLHQARIKIGLRGEGYDDFNIRIDRDSKGIALDIGGIHADKAYQYAQELGERSKYKELVMSYSRIVDKSGALVNFEDPDEKFPRGEPKQPYVSVMKSRILTPGEKAGAVASAALKASQTILFKEETVHTYHLHGRLNKKNYRENFSTIVQIMDHLLR